MTSSIGSFTIIQHQALRWLWYYWYLCIFIKNLVEWHILMLLVVLFVFSCGSML